MRCSWVFATRPPMKSHRIWLRSFVFCWSAACSSLRRGPRWVLPFFCSFHPKPIFISLCRARNWLSSLVHSPSGYNHRCSAYPPSDGSSAESNLRQYCKPVSIWSLSDMLASFPRSSWWRRKSPQAAQNRPAWMEIVKRRSRFKDDPVLRHFVAIYTYVRSILWLQQVLFILTHCSMLEATVESELRVRWVSGWQLCWQSCLEVYLLWRKALSLVVRYLLPKEYGCFW